MPVKSKMYCPKLLLLLLLDKIDSYPGFWNGNMGS